METVYNIKLQTGQRLSFIENILNPQNYYFLFVQDVYIT